MRLRALFCTSFSLFRSISSTSYSIAGRTFKQSSIFVPRLSEPISILEADERTQNALVDIALDTNDQVNSDPYGSVLWPAALSVAARVLEYSDLKECNIVELGAGTGLVSLACALAGAKSVTATDYHPLILEVVKLASTIQVRKLPNFYTQLFDVKNLTQPLPPCDLLLIADMLYDPSLGCAVGRRIHEARERGTRVLIGDSPNRAGRKDMILTLASLGVPTVFKSVAGQTVTGYRHDLISALATAQPEPVSISLLELP